MRAMGGNEIVKRTLTVVVQFNEDILPEWIWDCHKTNSFMNGVLIKAIYEGDLTRIEN